jgi:hypothetical protein
VTFVGSPATYSDAEEVGSEPAAPARPAESLFGSEETETFEELTRPVKRPSFLFDAEEEGWA